jgi:hypothetical protein
VRDFDREHCDPELLALRSLGESVDDSADERHLAHCPLCQSELDQLRSVVAASRSTAYSGALTAPPSHLWSAIHDELHDSGAPLSVATSTSTPTTRRRDRTQRGSRRRPTAAAPRHRALSLAVAAALTLGVSSGVALDRAMRADSVAPLASTTPILNEVTARVSLASLPKHSGSGIATVGRSVDGRVLTITTNRLTSGPGFYEVWLLDASGKQLVSLGALDGSGRGSFRVPTGLDLKRYPIVDVSLEPFDGNPAHSTDSIVRGTLSA